MSRCEDEERLNSEKKSNHKAQQKLISESETKIAENKAQLAKIRQNRKMVKQAIAESGKAKDLNTRKIQDLEAKFAWLTVPNSA